MRAVVQRVEDASVRVEGRAVGAIETGLLVYLGVGKDDIEEDARWLSEKISTLRIFPDSEYRMNLSVQDTKGSVLVVSQFTLYADARKGRRPSYDAAASPQEAKALYEFFVDCLRKTGLRVETGEFQAVMDVGYVNKGPVTLLLDSRKTF